MAVEPVRRSLSSQPNLEKTKNSLTTSRHETLEDMQFYGMSECNCHIGAIACAVVALRNFRTLVKATLQPSNAMKQKFTNKLGKVTQPYQEEDCFRPFRWQWRTALIRSGGKEGTTHF
jgi:hypothetical protein